jgi:predicted O-methyltransferase YrrM
MVDRDRQQVIDEIYAFGREHGGMWNLHPEAARFMHLLLQAIVAKQVLEVGTSNGYSTIWIADALEKTGGWLTTLEINHDKIDMATENLERLDLNQRVRIIPGDARTTIHELDRRFDFVFIDADKESYEHYLSAALERVRPGGIVMADNVSSHSDELAGFVRRVESDPWLEPVHLPYGAGQLLIYVRPGR